MVKRIVISAVAALVLILTGLFPTNSQAAVNGQTSPSGKSGMTATANKKPIMVGNKFCPVSGEKIVKKYAKTCEYKGKIYNFCTQDCVVQFKKNPEKYIKKLNAEKSNMKNSKQSSN